MNAPSRAGSPILIPSRDLLAGLGGFALCAGLWAQAPPPPPAPPPAPAPAAVPAPAARPPLPKLPNGARGFDAGPQAQKPSPRLIAVGGGWGADEEETEPKLKSKTAKGYYTLGEELMFRLDFDKAIPPLEKAVQLKPDYLEAYKRLGEASAYSASFKKEDGRPLEEVLEGYRKSIVAFEQARRLAPKEADLHLDLGVLYFNTGQYQKAAEAFQEGLRLYPEEAEFSVTLLEYTTRTEIQLFIGRSYRLMGLDDRALAAFEEGLRIEPDERKWDLYRELGALYEATGAPEKALAAYGRLLSEQEAEGDRPEGEALVAVAAIHVRAGENGKAAEALQRAAATFEAELATHERYPPADDDEPAWKEEWEEKRRAHRTQLAAASYNLGAVRIASGQFQESLGPLQRALELAPDHPGARFDLGFAALKLGDSKTAEAQLEPLRKVAPDMATELEAMIR